MKKAYITECMQWYVYVYFNPLKPDIKYSGGFEPFYVGKGKSDRDLSHLLECNLKSEKNRHKVNTIKKIFKQKLIPIISKVFKTDIEEDAYSEEIRLIAYYGRSDLNRGPLTNLTDGGNGKRNIIISEKTKQLLSITTSQAHADGKLKSNTAAWSKMGLLKAHSPEGKRKSALSRIGLKRAEETCKKISKSRALYLEKLTVAERKIILGTMRGKQHTDASRILMSKNISAACARPEVKARRSAANTGGKNPRAKPVSVFGKKYAYIGEAVNCTGLSKYQLKREPTFKIL